MARTSLRVLVLAMAALLVAELAALTFRRHPTAPSPHAHAVVVSEDSLRATLGRRVRRMLAAEQVDALESLADSLRRHHVELPSGAWCYALMFSDGFGEVDPPGDAADWERHLAAIRAWEEQHPDSLSPRLALAAALIGEGWAARGFGYSNTVTAQRHARFRSDLEEAAQILDQCPARGKTDYVWYRERLEALHGLGAREDHEYRALSAVACAAYPDHVPLYISMARHLMPRWYGEPGEWLRFASSCVDSLPEPLGAEIYARIVVDQYPYEPDMFRAADPPSWATVRRGLLAWHARDPASHRPLSDLAWIASYLGHRDDARMAFTSLGDTVEIDRWDSWKEYDRARVWALAPPVAANAH